MKIKLGKQNESGQILVILLIAVVVLLGFTALAVDGGMVYSDRRLAQSGADASALAGASAAATEMENTDSHPKVIYTDFPCDVGTLPAVNQTKYGTPSGGVLAAINSAKSSARNRASGNGFTITDNITSSNGVDAKCGIMNMGGYYEKFVDVTVMITTETSTTFAQIVFGGKLKNTVTTVVRVRPTNTLAYGYAIASLSPSCDNNVGGVDFSGTIDVQIYGGGIFSNSCLIKGGSSVIGVHNTDAGIKYHTTYTSNSHPENMTPAPTIAEKPIPFADPAYPPCSNAAMPWRGDSNHDWSGSGSIEPGKYHDIKINNGDVLKLQPGLYCITGDFKATGGTISVDTVGTCTSAANGSLDGVTIFIVPPASGSPGVFNIPGSTHINLQANSNPPPENSALQCRLLSGMLIYSPAKTTISMLGNSESSYRGTIYGSTSVINAGGTSGQEPTLNTQLIGGYVNVFGNASIEINFNGSDNYLRPALVDMLK